MGGQVRIGRAQVLALMVGMGAFGVLTGTLGVGPGGEAWIPALLWRLVWDCLLLLPGLCLLKYRPAKGYRPPGLLARPAAFAAALLFALLAAQTAATYSGFLQASVYEEGTPPGLGAALLWAAAVYAAEVGVAAQGRCAWYVLGLLGLGTLTVALTLLPELHGLSAAGLLRFSPAETLRVSLSLLPGRRAPLLAFPLLSCLRQPEKGCGAAVGALGLLTLLQGGAALYLSGVLGAFGPLRPYPLYTLASLAQLGVLKRLEGVYLGLWAFTAAGAAGALLWSAVQALSAYLDWEKRGWLRWGFYAFWGGLSLLACQNGDCASALTALGGSLWVYLPLLGLPLLYTPLPGREAAQ